MKFTIELIFWGVMGALLGWWIRSDLNNDWIDWAVSQNYAHYNSTGDLIWNAPEPEWLK